MFIFVITFLFQDHQSTTAIHLFTMEYETMSNELILCIWEYLSKADAIFSFSNLNDRLTRLLTEFCHMYTEISLLHASLTACRFLSRHIPRTDEWCLNLVSLQLGHPHRCAQIDMFANEVFATLAENHFTSLGRPCLNVSPELLTVILMRKKILLPLFPQLKNLVIRQFTAMSDHCRDILLNLVAGSPTMKTMMWYSYRLQVHHSRALFDWLFRPSISHARASGLERCQVNSGFDNLGYELMYEHTIIAGYQPHLSLACLNIDVLNLKTLYVLLHYLPALQQLGKPSISPEVTLSELHSP
jgi:hypothetical protein